jgi:peptidoglycan/LPS O-acetylase OafA/YrhL
MTSPTPTAPPETNVQPKYFHSIDVLRGFAALSVVFWHWQHFFYLGTSLGPFVRERQPFYRLFEPLYLQGSRAVDLFYCVSGFVFTYLYADAIAAKKVSAGEFAWLRFTRLYPLHLLTLVFVAAFQSFWIQRHGAYFVFPKNDAWYFIQHLFLVSAWRENEMDSFNGPVWSVSIEMLMYAVFFIVSALHLRRWWSSIALILVGFALSRLHVPAVGRGLISFFAGTLCFDVYRMLRQHGLSRRLVSGAVVLVLLLWIIVPLNVHGRILPQWFYALGGREGSLPGLFLEYGTKYSYHLVLFPMTVLTLALVETYRGTFGRRLRIIGTISYSSYLLHFPLQMVFRALVDEPEKYYSPESMVLFFTCLIALSLASFRFFERPVQSLLRQWKGSHS